MKEGEVDTATDHGTGGRNWRDTLHAREADGAQERTKPGSGSRPSEGAWPATPVCWWSLVMAALAGGLGPQLDCRTPE